MIKSWLKIDQNSDFLQKFYMRFSGAKMSDFCKNPRTSETSEKRCNPHGVYVLGIRTFHPDSSEDTLRGTRTDRMCAYSTSETSEPECRKNFNGCFWKGEWVLR